MMDLSWLVMLRVPRSPLVAMMFFALVGFVATPAARGQPFEPEPDTPRRPPGSAPLDVEHHRDPRRLVVTLAAHAPHPPVAFREASELDQDSFVPQLNMATYEVPEHRAHALARWMGKHPAVHSVEFDTVARNFAIEPNDTHWDRQWGLRHIGAPRAWGSTTGDEEVTVAVLDTGVDASHDDLAGAVQSGRNFTDESGPHVTTDRDGHGTRTAGVALARTNNGAGIAGTCGACSVLPVKVMRTAGEGNMSDVAEGVVWAVDHGADVITMSLGSRSNLTVMRDAVAYAAAHGVTMVAAAGNYGLPGGTSGSTPTYPAAYDDVLGVAASLRDDTRRPASSHGNWVELAAPGCNPATDLGGAYTSYCGTSAAAPLVAGTLALAQAADPDASRARLTRAVTSTATEVGYVERGRIHAGAALDTLPTIRDQPASDGESAAERDDPDTEESGGVTIRRIAGTGRMETAARLSAYAFEPGVDRVYLATGTTFPDALAAGATAGVDRGPVLLAARNGVPEATRHELARLDPEQIIVVGGRAALSSATARAAGRAGDAELHRVVGGDRFETAANLALGRFGASGVDTAYVATGLEFPDALAGVPAAVDDHAPVLLATRDRLPASTRAALAELDPDRVEVLGGPAAISPAVARQLGELGADVRRLAGEHRFATAAEVARAHFDHTAPVVHLATGDDFPDALAGGPVAGMNGGPQLLVTRDALPSATAARLRALRPDEQLTLGGLGVISYDVEARAAEASAGDGDQGSPRTDTATLAETLIRWLTTPFR